MECSVQHASIDSEHAAEAEPLAQCPPLSDRLSMAMPFHHIRLSMLERKCFVEVSSPLKRSMRFRGSKATHKPVSAPLQRVHHDFWERSGSGLRRKFVLALQGFQSNRCFFSMARWHGEDTLEWHVVHCATGIYISTLPQNIMLCNKDAPYLMIRSCHCQCRLHFMCEYCVTLS